MRCLIDTIHNLTLISSDTQFRKYDLITND